MQSCPVIFMLFTSDGANTIVKLFGVGITPTDVPPVRVTIAPVWFANVYTASPTPKGLNDWNCSLVISRYVWSTYPSKNNSNVPELAL